LKANKRQHKKVPNSTAILAVLLTIAIEERISQPSTDKGCFTRSP